MVGKARVPAADEVFRKDNYPWGQARTTGSPLTKKQSSPMIFSGNSKEAAMSVVTGMNLSQFLDALIQDEAFRQTFESDRKQVVSEIEISPEQKQLLANLDVNALVAGGNSVKSTLLRGAMI